MKKITLFAAILMLINNAANAQANTTASQAANLVLTNAIDMTFTANGNATGPLVSLPFSTTNDYANGVTSAAQQLKVRSNKNFNVTVKSSATNFTYTGTTSPAPVMPVANVLDVKVSANGTGGAIAGTFANYTDISTTYDYRSYLRRQPDLLSNVPGNTGLVLSGRYICSGRNVYSHAAIIRSLLSSICEGPFPGPFSFFKKT